MGQEEGRVRYANNGTAAAGEGAGWRRGWQEFLTALLQALSVWVS
jgi:hypothetical protein